tara:strand:+ start:1773 stop:2273 length:501 start_codon:yes stop_codon:yes gene_type:complete
MYFSFLNTLKTCTKILENLEALTLILEMNDDDYDCFLKRKENNIKNEDLRCFLLLNSFSISDLVVKTNDDIKSIGKVVPDTLEKVEVDLSKHDSLWNQYLNDRKDKDFIEMSTDISNVSVVCKKWLRYLQDEEDRGTESSYSDYSGDSTETSDDDEEDDDRTNSSS